MIPITTVDAPTGRGLRPYAVTCEQLDQPLGIDERRPRLGWRLASDRQGDAETAHRIVVAATAEDLAAEERLLWDTGWRAGPHPVSVEYDGPALQSSTRYHWSVQVKDRDGAVAPPASSWFETGLLHGEWEASWIAHDPLADGPLEAPQDDDRTSRTRHLLPVAHLRREYHLPARPTRARAYVTARGAYRLFVNGQRVGDVELAPGWTDYRERIEYQAYDITGLLEAGDNAFAAQLADGWWSGFVGFDSRHAAQHYGTAPQFLAQFLFDLPDGSQRTLATDGQWSERDGGIRYADMLMGEHVDARRQLVGWDRPNHPTDGWSPVLVVDDDTSKLEASLAQPVRVVERLSPIAVQERGHGRYVVDLGQNLVGRAALRVRGAEPGRRIEMRFAEILDADGELYLDNLRTAEATDVFVAAGHPEEYFEPAFTFHGFRYVEVRGYPGEVLADDLCAEVLQSDTPWTGTFDSSDELVDQLVSNLQWGQRGNFVSVPTDCPQRDERLGWLGDAQIFLPTAMRNADVAAFFTRWMRDVVTAQQPDGAFTDVVPVVAMTGPAAPGWGDAGTIIPWLLYREYGDRRVLDRSFDAMRRWVDYVHRHNPDLLWRRRTNRNYGDWLQVGAHTPRDVLATAYFARSASITADAAEVLGKEQDCRRFRKLAADIRDAFTRAFWSDGRLEDETQTGYLLALGFDLLPDSDRPAAATRLAALIEEADGHLTTGFLGVALLCPVLCDIGRADLAYVLLHQDTYPSWNYSIHHGATTIWERWDGWTEEHGFQSAEMNSFNHYSLGSVGDWLYGYVAGIRQPADSVAWERALIEPVVGGRLEHASAQQHTVRGVIGSSWTRHDDRLDLEVSLPPGVDATVVVPADSAEELQEGGQPLGADLPVTVGDGRVSIQVPSGTYRFTVRRTVDPGGSGRL